jgi:hypothetical protein
VAYGDARRYREADALHQRVSAWVEQHLGREHPQFAVVERSRATGLIRVARYTQAFDVLQRASASAARQQTPIHRVSFLQSRAMAGLYSGHPHAAVQDLFDASEIARRELRTLPDMRWRTEEELAWALFEIGAQREAAAVVQQIPPEAGNALRAALLRVLLAQLGVAPRDPASLQPERDKVATRPCLKGELAALEATLAGRELRDVDAMPPQCDGQSGSLAAALGARWTPDWAVDFPPQPFRSELVARLSQRDTTARALPASLAPAWERWQQSAQADVATNPSAQD